MTDTGESAASINRRGGDEAPNLGPCCACRKTGPTVRNIMLLNKKAPIAGHGWGCVVCGLPMDGASAVLCDACMTSGREPVEACRGWPGIDGRVPIDTLVEPHEHDASRHLDDEIVVEDWPA